MNFNEICQEAELTRDEIYGIGTDNWEIYASDLVDTQEQEKQESEYRKLKRIKAENTANYRKQLETVRVSSITDTPTKLHYTRHNKLLLVLWSKKD